VVSLHLARPADGPTLGALVAMDGKDEDAFREQVGAISQDAEYLASASALALSLSKLAASIQRGPGAAHVPGAHLDRLSAQAGARKEVSPRVSGVGVSYREVDELLRTERHPVGQSLVFHITGGRANGAKTGGSSRAPEI